MFFLHYFGPVSKAPAPAEVVEQISETITEHIPRPPQKVLPQAAPRGIMAHIRHFAYSQAHAPTPAWYVPPEINIHSGPDVIHAAKELSTKYLVNGEVSAKDVIEAAHGKLNKHPGSAPTVQEVNDAIAAKNSLFDLFEAKNHAKPRRPP